MDVRIDVAGRIVRARERVTFTNPTSKDVTELVFHVYPRHRVVESDRPMVAKTLEVLRLSPEEAMDSEGRRITVNSAKVDGKDLAIAFDQKNDTVMMVATLAEGRPCPASR